MPKCPPRGSVNQTPDYGKVVAVRGPGQGALWSQREKAAAVSICLAQVPNTMFQLVSHHLCSLIQPSKGQKQQLEEKRSQEGGGKQRCPGPDTSKGKALNCIKMIITVDQAKVIQL